MSVIIIIIFIVYYGYRQPQYKQCMYTHTD